VYDVFRFFGFIFILQRMVWLALVHFFPSNLPANQDVPHNPLPNRSIVYFVLLPNRLCICAFLLSLPAPKKEIISDGGQSIFYTLPTTEESYPSYIS
jgi:hypothetical protein